MKELKKMASLQEQLKRISANLNNSNVVKVLLQKEANKLYACIYEEIQNYYLSYQPKVWEEYRTYGLLNSLRIEPIKQFGNQLSIRIYFDESMATHPSIFGGESGFTPLLINYGWKWSNDPGIYHLSNYEGYHFVEKGIQKYINSSPLNIKINVNGTYKGKNVANQEYLK